MPVEQEAAGQRVQVLQVAPALFARVIRHLQSCEQGLQELHGPERQVREAQEGQRAAGVWAVLVRPHLWAK